MALKEKEDEVDIQEAFDSLLVCEDNFVNKAFEEGRIQGEKSGYQEGFDLGYKKGSEISTEIYFYKGFAKSWIALISNDASDFSKTFTQLLEPCLPSVDTDIVLELKTIEKHIYQTNQEVDPKTLKALQRLLQLLQNFPEENPKNQDIVSLLQDIRAKFKHCCALLKVDTSYSAKSELNF